MRTQIPAAVMLASLLAGCAIAPQPSPASQPVPSRTFASSDQEVTYRVFMGELALQRGDRQDAIREYARAAELSHDPALTRRALTLAYQAGDNQLAWKLDQQWLLLAPADKDALRFRAVLAARLGHADEAARYFDDLIQGARGGYLSVAVLLGQETTAGQGLPVMQGMVNAAPDSADAHYAYAELALHYQRAGLAEQEARRALAIKPDLDSARIMLARALAEQGKYDEAIAIIRPHVQGATDTTEMRLVYATLLAQAGRIDEASTEFQAILKLQPSNGQALYSLGLLQLSSHQYTAAHASFLRLYNSGQQNDSAAYFLGNAAELQHHYPEALDWYRRIDEGERWLPAQIAIARVLLASGLPDAARKFMDEMVADYPDAAIQLRAAEAGLFSDRGDIAGARRILNDALGVAPDNEDLLYARALLEESNGEIAASERDLQLIIKQSPGNAEALNALGYTLVVHSTRYQEALGYIERALNLMPDNAAILDSMGWVQYRLGHTELAMKYLRLAYQHQQDPEIAAHLVEVLLVAGKRQEAHALWVAASKQHPNSADLKKLSGQVMP